MRKETLHDAHAPPTLMNSVTETNSNTIRSNKPAVHVDYIGAGGYGEIHCVRPPNSYNTDVADSQYANTTGGYPSA
jgi:hypothetical protein